MLQVLIEMLSHNCVHDLAGFLISKKEKTDLVKP